jgi:polygalacturonase
MAPPAYMGEHGPVGDHTVEATITRPQIHDFVRAFGGVADEPQAARHNTAALNHSLRSLGRGDTLHVPAETFYITGGVEGDGLVDVTISIDGSLVFSPDPHTWPHSWGRRLGVSAATEPMPCPLPRTNATRYGGRGYLAGMAFYNCDNLTLTSSNGRGELNGNGRAWWSLPGIGYLMRHEDRPRLLTVAASRGVLVEGLLLLDSPFWTTLFERVDDLEIRHCGVVARRTDARSHGLVGPAACNAHVGRGCSPTCQRLQPCALEAAAVWCSGGCNCMQERLQPVCRSTSPPSTPTGLTWRAAGMSGSMTP